MPRAEKELIAHLRSLAPVSPSGRRTVVTGIGDDCAVLRPPPGHDVLVTTDFCLEGVHFRREWHRPELIGHRCLARGLSDIAAMGGQSLALFLSLALPADVTQAWVDRFMTGLLRLARQHKVPLAGGDTAQSPAGVSADIIVLGSAPRGNAVLRSGAQPGDRIYVTGILGSGGATVRRLYAGEKIPPESVPHYFLPQPRLEAGQKLRNLASAMIDISDSLTTDLSHICEESSVGAVIYAPNVPLANASTLDDALYAGDEYELLFTSSKRIPSEIAGVAVTEIGEIVKRPGMWLQDERGRTTRLKAKGWEHFAH